MTLPATIEERIGQSASTRVGVVVSTSPLRVRIQGVVFEGDSVGRLKSATPAIGDRVLLLGQSVSGSASSGSTWIILDTILPT